MLVEDDMMVGFEPPTLVSLRCDMMKKTGDLDREKEFVPSRDLNKGESTSDSTETPPAEAEKENFTKSSQPVAKKSSSSEDEAGSQPIRDSLSL
jgi:hypothetical protein